jgi:hypothetical protein
LESAKIEIVARAPIQGHGKLSNSGPSFRTPEAVNEWADNSGFGKTAGEFELRPTAWRRWCGEDAIPAQREPIAEAAQLTA